MTQLHELKITKPDGRTVHFFSRKPLPASPKIYHMGVTRPGEWKAPEIREHHLTGERVSLSASRQGRPHLPQASLCPLCTKTPDDPPEEQARVELPTVDFSYEWATFENLFPALWLGNETGHCEVVLYSTDHDTHLAHLSTSAIEGIVGVWQHRSRELGARDDIQSVFLFENRGAEIGVTLHHPHGQLYAFNHIPPVLAAEMDHADSYYSRNMGCLVCDSVTEFDAEGTLMVHSGEHIVAFVPPAPHFPYEVHVTTRAHRTHIECLTEAEVSELARVLKGLVQAYDRLFGFPLPYIMQHHQCPSHAKEHHSYHWNIQFTPFHRSANKLKYLAGVETGMGFFVNDSLPEEKALELRNLFQLPNSGG